MCEDCKPWIELSAEQIERQTDRLSATFVGLAHVTGAPLISGAAHWLEVARHQVELGVRSCLDIPPIKTWTAGDSLDRTHASGSWTYDDGVEVESSADRIKRMARAERDLYRAEVERRRKNGTLGKSRRPELGDPVKAPTKSKAKPRKKK